MKKNTSLKFIVIEGPDGSGKATQTKLLTNFLKKKKNKVKKIDFPQYGKKSAGLVEEYLNGKYGKPKEVGPYRASIFYACDRYDASFKMKRWIENGYIVVADRYISSNVAHQGGKIKNKEKRRKYLKWLYDLEYNIFEIPKPEATIVLKTSTEFSYKLSSKIKDKEKIIKKHLYLGKRKRDVHEKDKDHLRDSLKVYLEMAKEYPKDFKVIECIEKGKLLSPEKIHFKIKKELNLI
jgi:dTMP kinase